MISVTDLSWSFDTQKVLEGINLEISPGAFTTILGPNGSGKTTLVRLLLRYLKPRKKAVVLENRDILSINRKEYARKIAHVPQNSKTAFEYTVFQMVLMGRHPHLKRFQLESARDFAIVEDAMRKADVWYLKDKCVTQISGGEAQRVIIARALAQEPSVLVLDEPTSHLDIQHQENILTLIKDLCFEKGLTVLAVLHDINQALEYSDYIVLLREGRIFDFGKPEEVITEKAVKEIYNLETDLFKHPHTGKPYIIPRRRAGIVKGV